jgi:predicted transposase YbfD/YdcC
VEKIIDEEADYVIGLKKNQPSLYEATDEHFAFNTTEKKTIPR